MPTYVIAFRTTDMGLSPIFSKVQTLINGTPITPHPLITEISDGLYKFSFEAVEDTVFVIDGGAQISDPEIRYVRGVLSPQDQRLDAAISTVPGLLLTQALLSNPVANTVADAMFRAIRADKILRGRWKIQGTQLLMYDDDGITILRTFDLRDSQGQPSATNVFERMPTIT
jgi:hypothetical protein